MKIKDWKTAEHINELITVLKVVTDAKKKLVKSQNYKLAKILRNAECQITQEMNFLEEL